MLTKSELWLLPLCVTLQVLVWPQLLSPLCSPHTTTCSWAGHFTICTTHLERVYPGCPATIPGMLSETVPAVFQATTPTCSLPANSSSSEFSSFTAAEICCFYIFKLVLALAWRLIKVVLCEHDFLPRFWLFHMRFLYLCIYVFCISSNMWI